MNKRHGATRYPSQYISISGKSSGKGTKGRTLASSKVSLKVFSDSPDIPETIDGADMLINGTPSSFYSDKPNAYDFHRHWTLTPAIAFARRVFPHPGGPCNNTPLGGCTPVCRYTSGWHSGMATSSSIFSTHASTPPRSANRVVGGVWSFAIVPPEPEAGTEANLARLVLLESGARDERILRLPLAREGCWDISEDSGNRDGARGVGRAAGGGSVISGVGAAESSAGVATPGDAGELRLSLVLR